MRAHPTFKVSHLLPPLMVLASACNPSSCIPTIEFPDAGFAALHRAEDPIQQELVVQGVVRRVDADSGQSSSTSGVDVKAGVDRNHNGSLDTGEFVAGETDSDGKYRLEMAVSMGDRVVVSYKRDGLAPVFKTIQAGPMANVRINVSMTELQDLTCTGPRCANKDGNLSLGGLASGVGGQAKAFNPVTETAAFPGGFDDADGNLLLSGVFSAVKLEDSSGNAVETLNQPADLRMRVPKDTWGIIKDLTPGNDRVEVPMFAFDELAGTWTRQGQGFLETDLGVIITESQLASIRAGTFSGGVMAHASVSHFSYWNVDWPVNTKGCITGIILDRNGQPAQGATVTASGVTYTGSSPQVTVGADGRFCVQVMRSEGGSEDVDQDGVNGETQRIRIRVSYRGVLYDMGTYDAANTAAVCGGACKDVGSLQVSLEKELVPTACSVSGRVVDKAGVGVVGATVFAMDTSLEADMLTSICVSDPTACSFSSQSGANGAFSLRTAILDSITVLASSTEESGGVTRTRVGMITQQQCPTGDVTVVMENGVDTYTLNVSVSGNTINWTPAVTASVLMVESPSGEPMWGLTAGTAGITPPITYGVVPAGNESTVARDGGAPPPLASGSKVHVYLGGEGDGGYPTVGTGEATVP